MEHALTRALRRSRGTPRPVNGEPLPTAASTATDGRRISRTADSARGSAPHNALSVPSATMVVDGEGLTMTTISTSKASVRRMSRDQLRTEIRRLLSRSGMSRATLQARGDAYELDAEKRGLLAEIQGLEWLLGTRS